MTNLLDSNFGFCLTPDLEPMTKRKWRLPDQVVEFCIPGPHERSVTVCVTLRRPNGKLVQVPVVWHPGTKIIKKLHRLTWAELGVTERLNQLREQIIRLAKKEHKRLATKYATLDLFGHEEL